MVWAAALGLVGTPFRFHGRDPATGLDCVGLVAAAYRAAGCFVPPPPPYRVGDMDAVSAARLLSDVGLAEVADAAIGDVVLAMVAHRQPHLLIAGPDAFVHAHAGLRRVVLMPGGAPGVVLGRWRMVCANRPTPNPSRKREGSVSAFD